MGPDEFGQYAAGGGLGALVVTLIFRIWLRRMAEERVGAKRADGEADIIETLRSEVTRLAGINEAMSGRLQDLHREVENMRLENIDLKAELQTLTGEVRRLRSRPTPPCQNSGECPLAIAPSHAA